MITIRKPMLFFPRQSLDRVRARRDLVFDLLCEFGDELVVPIPLESMLYGVHSFRAVGRPFRRNVQRILLTAQYSKVVAFVFVLRRWRGKIVC